MPIQVACQCGARFSAKDELAGRRVKCPKCAQPLSIPQPAHQVADPALAALLDEEGVEAVEGPRCPGCGVPTRPGTVLCVECGYDHRSGRRLATRVGVAVEMEEEGIDFDSHGNELLDKAERDMARLKQEESRMSTGMPWWLWLIALLGLISFTIGMVLMPQDRVLLASGISMIAFGALVQLFFGIRMLLVAFNESPIIGIMYLVVPFYSLYFIITRWDQVGGMFIFVLLGAGIQSLGYFMAYVAPGLLEKKDEDEISRLVRPPIVVVAALEPGTVV